MFYMDFINCLIWQGSEEADKDEDWNPGNDSDSDPDSEAEEDYDYEDEKRSNLLNGPSPVRLAAV